MKLKRTKAVAVFSVLSLVAAFLVSGVVGSTAAQAAGETLTTFKLKPFSYSNDCGSGVRNFRIVDVTNVVDGNGTWRYENVDFPGTFYEASFVEAKATATTLEFTRLNDQNAKFFEANLKGSNWVGYSGSAVSTSS